MWISQIDITLLLLTVSVPAMCYVAHILYKTLITNEQFFYPGSGKGHSQLPLSAAVKYYTTVRAVTGAGNVLESASDGILVDVTAPVAEIPSLGGKTLNRTHARTGSTEALYQKETDSYTVGWHVDDRESGVNDVWFRVGTYPGTSTR